MPLPQQVINQLGQEPPKTPGWSSGILFFTGALLVIVVGIYLGLVFIYEPHLNAELAAVQGQVSTLSQSISSGDQANLISFYSQTENLQSLLQNHVTFSVFLSWLEENTEANISYSQFSFSSGNEINLTGTGKTEADVAQQIAIFEASPVVQSVSVSSITATGASGLWDFSAVLLVNPAYFTAQGVSTSTPISSSSSTQTSTTP
jgi:hypothetical protein